MAGQHSIAHKPPSWLADRWRAVGEEGRGRLRCFGAPGQGPGSQSAFTSVAVDGDHGLPEHSGDTFTCLSMQRDSERIVKQALRPATAAADRKLLKPATPALAHHLCPHGLGIQSHRQVGQPQLPSVVPQVPSVVPQASAAAPSRSWPTGR